MFICHSFRDCHPEEKTFYTQFLLQRQQWFFTNSGTNLPHLHSGSAQHFTHGPPDGAHAAPAELVDEDVRTDPSRCARAELSVFAHRGPAQGPPAPPRRAAFARRGRRGAGRGSRGESGTATPPVRRTLVHPIAARLWPRTPHFRAFFRRNRPMPAAPTKNARLLAWVDEVRALTQPDRVVWCDGSAARSTTGLCQQ